MAISIQSELVSAVQNWLARTDLTSTRIAEFIQLAEAKLNRELRAQDQETKSTTFSITGEYVAVPADFLEVRSFQTTSGGVRYSLKQMDLESETEHYNETGAPRFFAVVGSNFRFSPSPDATYTATLVYYATITALGTTGSNFNWVLTKHPDIYLYATLLESTAYVQTEPQQIMLWKAGYDEGVAKLQKHAQRNRYGGPGLATRPG